MSLKEKIAALTAKKGGPDSSLARKDGRSEAAMRKIIRKSAVLADKITEDDLEASATVLRNAKLATHKVYDVDLKKLVEQPDHKTRLAAVTLERAYAEGLPVARAINVNADFESADDTLARLKSSPLAMKAIAGLRAAGVKLAIGEEIIDVEAIPLPAQSEEEKANS